MKSSLHSTHPWRYYMVLLIFFNLALLFASYGMPFMKAQRFFFFREEYTLLKSIGLMFEAGNVILATIIFLFSVIFPVGKLCLLLVVWFIPFHAGARHRAMHMISSVGKWSMLDVFIVAMLVILISARAATKAEPLIGLYVFTFAILLSMALTQWIQRLARRSPDAHELEV